MGRRRRIYKKHPDMMELNELLKKGIPIKIEENEKPEKILSKLKQENRKRKLNKIFRNKSKK